MRAPRIALLVDTWRIPSWIASIVADIAASDTAEIAAIIINEEAGKRDRTFPHYRWPSNPLKLAEMYLYLDYRIFRPTPDALEQVDLRERLKACPIVRTQPLFDGPYFRLNESDQNRLRRLDLDVLLLFWYGLPRNEVLPLARHGVWSFLDHELACTGHIPTGFWEVLKQCPVTVQRLQVKAVGAPHGMVLHHYYGPTHHRSISLARNNLFWKSASFISRKLDALHRGGSLDAVVNIGRCGGDESSIGRPAKCEASPQAPMQHQGDRHTSACERPSNLTILKTIGAHVLRFVRERASNLRYIDQWAIGYKYTSCQESLDRDFESYRWLIPPRDRYWADPFPVQTQGQDFLFFEQFLYSEHRGHLCVAAIDREGFIEEPIPILQREYHLSYPFVFSWNGERYLIPEAQETGRIDLYHFDSFPYGPRFVKTLMENVRACDTTLVEANSRWWMFVTLGAPGTWNVDELFLFSAETPLGPWLPHPQNPIKSDVRSARPAGRVFNRSGKYYRPAQDCSRGYGHAVRLHEIKQLSDTDYIEEEVEAIRPDWSSDVVAIHTLNIADALHVIDAKRRQRR